MNTLMSSNVLFPYVSPEKPLRSLANQMSYTDKKLATEGKLT